MGAKGTSRDIYYQHPDLQNAFGGSNYLGHTIADFPIIRDGTEDRAAALAVCSRARNKADAVLLLTACGLIPDNREAR